MAGTWGAQLDEVVRTRYPRLVAHARLLVRSGGEAEDLVQDALIRTFSSRAKLASVPEAEAYVRRAIVTRFLDLQRKRTTERAAYTRVAGMADGVPGCEVPELPHFASEVEIALGCLSPRERACVVLRHVEDLSIRETAAALRLTEGAVKRYTHDGVATLGSILRTSTTTSDDDAIDVITRTGGARR